MNVVVSTVQPEMLADIVILKNTWQEGAGSKGRMMSACTHCGRAFVMTLRRMKPTGRVVRNVSQCVSCRNRYAKQRRAARALGLLP